MGGDASVGAVALEHWSTGALRWVAERSPVLMLFLVLTVSHTHIGPSNCTPSHKVAGLTQLIRH